jgi:hypothetical protein
VKHALKVLWKTKTEKVPAFVTVLYLLPIMTTFVSALALSIYYSFSYDSIGSSSVIFPQAFELLSTADKFGMTGWQYRLIFLSGVFVMAILRLIIYRQEEQIKKERELKNFGDIFKEGK